MFGLYVKFRGSFVRLLPSSIYKKGAVNQFPINGAGIHLRRPSKEGAMADGLRIRLGVHNLTDNQIASFRETYREMMGDHR
jgi:hypothetical protein